MLLFSSEWQMFPFHRLSAYMSLELAIATRKIVFHVKHFKGDKFNGSGRGLLMSLRALCRFHSGTTLTTGGLELNIPYSNLIIFGC